MTARGWYPDGAGATRWFDGTAWTEHTALVGAQGAYALLGELGRGAFGTAYLATHPVSGQQVAVKVFAHPTDQARVELAREAQALVSVRHGNCLQILDVIDTDDTLALVTDFVPGATLRQLLDHHGALAGPHALQLLWGAAHGLAAVHAAGLVHGDVKPANMLVQPDGVSKLIDFGLVARPGIASPDGSVSGSPAYAAPEQMLQGVRTPQSDIYAMSVTLYEVLANQRPYQARSVESMALAHAHEPVPDLRSVKPEAGPQLAALVRDGMAKRPEGRPQNMGAFLRRFEAAAEESYGATWLAVGGLAASVGGLAGAGLASGVTAASTAAAGSAIAGAVSTTAAGTSAVAGTTAAGATAGSSGAAVSAGLMGTVTAKVAAAAVAAVVVIGGGTAATVALTQSSTPAAPSTQIITLDPLTESGGLASGWMITRSVGSVGDCSDTTGVLGATGPDTYDLSGCSGSTPLGSHACWQSTDMRGRLLCVFDAEEMSQRRLVAYSVTNVPTSTVPAERPVPLMIELADGSQFIMPSHYQFAERADGLQALYLCGNAVGVCPKGSAANGDFSGILAAHAYNHLAHLTEASFINKSAPMWTVQVGLDGDTVKSFPAPTTMNVAKVYYASGAKDASAKAPDASIKKFDFANATYPLIGSAGRPIVLAHGLSSTTTAGYTSYTCLGSPTQAARAATGDATDYRSLPRSTCASSTTSSAIEFIDLNGDGYLDARVPVVIHEDAILWVPWLWRPDQHAAVPGWTADLANSYPVPSATPSTSGHYVVDWNGYRGATLGMSVSQVSATLHQPLNECGFVTYPSSTPDDFQNSRLTFQQVGAAAGQDDRTTVGTISAWHVGAFFPRGVNPAMDDDQVTTAMGPAMILVQAPTSHSPSYALMGPTGHWLYAGPSATPRVNGQGREVGIAQTLDWVIDFTVGGVGGC